MNTIHSTDWLLDIYRSNKLTITNNMNEPNKLDHCCPLKRGNTQSNYLAHNIEHIDKYELQMYKFQGFTRNQRISQYLE